MALLVLNLIKKPRARIHYVFRLLKSSDHLFRASFSVHIKVFEREKEVLKSLHIWWF